MALRDAFSRFLRHKAASRRDGDGDNAGAAENANHNAQALDNLADRVEAGDDPDLVVLVDRLEGYYLPDRDEFVPTATAVEIIEGFEDDSPDEQRQVVQQLGDQAPTAARQS